MNQILNERQWRFLNAAELAAGAKNRFSWRQVGGALGFSEDESRQIVQHLDRLVAIALPTEREAQFLPLGRELSHLPLTPPKISQRALTPSTNGNGRHHKADARKPAAHAPVAKSTAKAPAKKAKSNHRGDSADTWKRGAAPARSASRRATEPVRAKSNRRPASKSR